MHFLDFFFLSSDYPPAPMLIEAKLHEKSQGSQKEAFSYKSKCVNEKCGVPAKYRGDDDDIINYKE